MITSRREQLLGYLLGALEPEEHQDVERDLRTDAELRRQLETLERRLAPLESLPRDFPPPPGLTERTCAMVAMQSRRLPAVRPASQQRELTGGGGPQRWSLADAVVFGGVVAALLIMFFPAVFSSIDLARRDRCQDNLRQLGQSLVRFADYSSDRRFPEIPTSGNRSFAGVVGPMLQQRELLPQPSVVLCPNSPLADTGWEVVTLDQIDAARGDELSRLQTAALGSTGYNLGVKIDGQYQAARHQGRSHFVLMADAPRYSEGALVGNNHDGRGQNMLFDDNHTAYVVGCEVPGAKDHAFRNRLGRVEAGLGPNDSVIGHSATPPLLPSR